MKMQPRYLPAITLTIDDGMPDEMRAGVEAHIMSNLDLLPAWTIALHTDYDRNVMMAEIRPRPDYRRGALTIGGGWLEASESYRRRTIMHEFMHMHLAPLHHLAAELVDIAGKGNDALDSRLREDLRRALEQTTSDVEDLVHRLVQRGDGQPQEGPVMTSASPLERGSPRGPGPTD